MADGGDSDSAFFCFSEKTLDLPNRSDSGSICFCRGHLYITYDQLHYSNLSDRPLPINPSVNLSRLLFGFFFFWSCRLPGVASSPLPRPHSSKHRADRRCSLGYPPGGRRRQAHGVQVPSSGGGTARDSFVKTTECLLLRPLPGALHRWGRGTGVHVASRPPPAGGMVIHEQQPHACNCVAAAGGAGSIAGA